MSLTSGLLWAECFWLPLGPSEPQENTRALPAFPISQARGLGLCLAELNPLWATSWFLLFLLLQGLELLHQIKCLKSCPGLQLSLSWEEFGFRSPSAECNAALGKMVFLWLLLWLVKQQMSSSDVSPRKNLLPDSLVGLPTLSPSKGQKKIRDKRGERQICTC